MKYMDASISTVEATFGPAGGGTRTPRFAVTAGAWVAPPEGVNALASQDGSGAGCQ